MSATSRELVHQALEFRGPLRVPRQAWVLPWARLHHPEMVKRLAAEFPDDIAYAPAHVPPSRIARGDPYAVGTYVDEWGCEYENLQAGVIGEVKRPRILDWERDGDAIVFPEQWFSMDVDAVNRDCAASDRFILGGGINPFERLQFFRGSEMLYMDLADPPPAMMRFFRRLDEFHCRWMELWAKRTRVDGLIWSDDWGSQHSLLIRPALWRELFKPIYRDFIQIAHAHGKKAFMHSDGHILAIYPDLVELGLDAINSQLFCMGVDKLVPFAGKITFWGEIDRQHLLPRGTRGQIRDAVRSVRQNLYRDGGCIAQCEFSAGANPDNVYEVFAAWER